MGARRDEGSRTRLVWSQVKRNIGLESRGQTSYPVENFAKCRRIFVPRL